MDYEYFSVGWLFAPIIGFWGLASVALGLVQSSAPKRKIESYLLPVSTVVCVSLTFVAYMMFVFGSGIVSSAGRGEPFWWIYFVFILIPSLLVIASTLKYVKSKTESGAVWASTKVKIVAFIVLAMVPLSYSAVLLFYFRVL